MGGIASLNANEAFQKKLGGKCAKHDERLDKRDESMIIFLGVWLEAHSRLDRSNQPVQISLRGLSAVLTS